MPRHVFAMLLLLLPSAAWPWVLIGSRWATGEATIHVGLEEPWGSSYEDAMEEWNAKTSFTFRIIDDYRDPCEPSSEVLNSVSFDTTVCGDEWGQGTLAVAIGQFAAPEEQAEGLFFGLQPFSQSDVLFNENLQWDIYDGPLRDDDLWDFRRVALHELGHVLGLAHEDLIPAIMVSFQNDLDALQNDDIAAVEALYRPSHDYCDIEASSPRRDAALSGRIASGDCTFLEFLGAGGSHFARIFEARGDVYRLSYDFGPLSIRAHSDQIRLFTPIFTADGTQAARTTRGGFARLKCGTLYTYDSLPGEHFLWAGVSFREDARAQACPGTAAGGDYRISVFSRATPLLPELPRVSDGEAYFSGGATADDGQSFPARFAAGASPEVLASILPAPPHVGERASLYAVAMLSSERTFVRAANGWQAIGSAADFQERWDSNPFDAFSNLPALRGAASLGYEERLALGDILRENAGDGSVTFRIYVGYGLDANPEVIYHHAQPLEFSLESSPARITPSGLEFRQSCHSSAADCRGLPR